MDAHVFCIRCGQRLGQETAHSCVGLQFNVVDATAPHGASYGKVSFVYVSGGTLTHVSGLRAGDTAC